MISAHFHTQHKSANCFLYAAGPHSSQALKQPGSGNQTTTITTDSDRRLIFPDHEYSFNPYAGGGWFGQYKMMQNTWKNDWNPGTWVLIG